MSDRPPRTKSQPASESADDLSARTTAGTVGRYSLTTSERPPPKARQKSRPPSFDADSTAKWGSFNPDPDPEGLPAPPLPTPPPLPVIARPPELGPNGTIPAMAAVREPHPDSEPPTTIFQRRDVPLAPSSPPPAQGYVRPPPAAGTPAPRKPASTQMDVRPPSPMPPRPDGTPVSSPWAPLDRTASPPQGTPFRETVEAQPTIIVAPEARMSSSAPTQVAAAASVAPGPVAVQQLPSVPPPRTGTPLPTPAPLPTRMSTPLPTPAPIPAIPAAATANANGVAPPWDDPGFSPADDVDWQKLWLETQRRPWKTLVVIATAKGAPTVRVAQALAVVGFHHLGKAITVIDATVLTLGVLETRLSEMSSRKGRGEIVIVATGPVLDSPASLAFARATEAALLCVAIGDRIETAEKTVDEVGRTRFLGSIIVGK